MPLSIDKPYYVKHQGVECEQEPLYGLTELLDLSLIFFFFYASLIEYLKAKELLTTLVHDKLTALSFSCFSGKTSTCCPQ